MCVKTCQCNSCFKHQTCTDCVHIEKHKDADCATTGVTICVDYISYSRGGAANG
jgi:hypothetical protein